MIIKKLLLLFLAVCLLPATGLASATDAGPQFLSVPSLIKSGQPYTFTIWSPRADTVSIVLVHKVLKTAYLAIENVPVTEGEVIISWDGLLPSGEPLPLGEYAISCVFSDGERVLADTRIGVPYPQISGIQQSGDTVSADDEGISIQFSASVSGKVTVQLFRYADNTIIGESTMDAAAGENSFLWAGKLAGEPVEDGEYSFILSLEDAAGEASQQQYVFVQVAQEQVQIAKDPEPDFNDLTTSIIKAYEHLYLSPTYGSKADDSFWSMHPGETDDAILWDVLTQPITVYDDGRIGSIGHVYMRENPDGTGKRVAQIHGESQGLHVIGEVNEHGYVLVEAFSNYDPSFTPVTDEEKEYAFDIRRGYLKAEHLKTIPVRQDIAFVVDKLTQRMYMFRDGVRVTEFVISTGKITNGKYYRETIPGEFITVGFSAGYWDNDIYTAMAIRFNGGTMLHEVPHTVGSDGTKYYGTFARYLGAKHSAGCVRVPYWENEEGYNQRWLYNNLDHKGNYKIIVWDDLNRYDMPVTWR